MNRVHHVLQRIGALTHEIIWSLDTIVGNVGEFFNFQTTVESMDYNNLVSKLPPVLIVCFKLLSNWVVVWNES